MKSSWRRYFFDNEGCNVVRFKPEERNYWEFGDE